MAPRRSAVRKKPDRERRSDNLEDAGAFFVNRYATGDVFSQSEGVSLRHCFIYITDESDRMALKLAFETEALRDLCTSEVIALQELPPLVAQSLFRRLADIRAASNILYLPVGKPAELDAAPPGLVVVKLHQNHHLLFSAAHQQVPILSSGNVNWGSVTDVKLLKIGNYDDE